MDTRIHSSLCGIKRQEYHVYSSKRSGSSIIFAPQVRRVFEEGAHSKIERDEEICPLDLKDIFYLYVKFTMKKCKMVSVFT